MNTLSSMLKFLGETLGANPNTLTTTNKTLVAAINEVRSMVYPVGSYLWTSDAGFDPNITFGGTWEKMDEGVVLVSAGTNYPIASGTAKDGGDATRTLATTNLPSHRHYIANQTISIKAKSNSSGSGSSDLYYVNGDLSKTLTLNAHYTNNTGDGTAFSIMQPYKNAYCWHRTA